jgi:hypothetical protein
MMEIKAGRFNFDQVHISKPTIETGTRSIAMSDNQAVEKTETKEERKARKAAKKQVSSPGQTFDLSI